MQFYSPGISDVLQHQGADLSVGHCIPVNSVWHAVLQVQAEVKVQVENVQAVRIS